MAETKIRKTVLCCVLVLCCVAAILMHKREESARAKEQSEEALMNVGRRELASYGHLDQVNPAVSADPSTKAKTDKVANGNNDFALDFYRFKAAHQEDNLFFSPYSLSAALAMTYAGARGRTADEMAKVLHFGQGNGFHQDFGLLEKQLKTRNSGGCKFLIANAIWRQEGLELLSDYLTIVRKDYGGNVYEVDFRQVEEARLTINGWVSDQTQKRIPDLIPPGILHSGTPLVLTNAIYFKGKWQSEFRKEHTNDRPFQTTGTTSVMVPTMFQHSKMQYAQDENVQALEMSYSDGNLSMIILLPNKQMGIDGIEWTTGKIISLISEFAPVELDVYVPKFQLRSKYMLEEDFAAMGMPTAFGDDADFSGMGADLCIAHIIHEAFVDVNEEGTEAAAATAVIMRAKSMPVREIEFRADHPFLFLIRDRPTGSILFMGKICNPQSTE